MNAQKKKLFSGTGNRTQGLTVRASNVSHYTIPDSDDWMLAAGLMSNIEGLTPDLTTA